MRFLQGNLFHPKCMRENLRNDNPKLGLKIGNETKIKVSLMFEYTDPLIDEPW